MSEWIEYSGSNEQIAEMQNSYYGFLLKLNEKIKGIYRKNDLSSIEGKMVLPGFRHEITHYLICNPHPLADMIIRQAQTGQPVWIKLPRDAYFDNTYPGKVGDTARLKKNWFEMVTDKPDWNMPNAEYSFSTFEKDHSFTPFED